jgi:predicted nuclease of restriction endonuclease-like (RecB) superfamily
MFYQRLLSSRDKENVAREIEKSAPKPEYTKIVHDPYVLEFLELEDNEHFYEDDLEQAIIDHLQKFFLEMGRGFTFVGRQVHVVIGTKHFHIDLVLYNILLRCYVLIDLKIDELTHEDIGQMQMYVNYYTRERMNPGDIPPIGILLCAEKDDAVVQYTLPEDNQQIYAAKYMPYLPSKEELKRELNLDDFEKK